MWTHRISPASRSAERRLIARAQERYRRGEVAEHAVPVGSDVAAGAIEVVWAVGRRGVARAMVAVGQVGILVVAVVVLHIAHADDSMRAGTGILEAEALAGARGTCGRARVEGLVLQRLCCVVAFGEVAECVRVGPGGSVAVVSLRGNGGYYGRLSVYVRVAV